MVEVGAVEVGAAVVSAVLDGAGWLLVSDAAGAGCDTEVAAVPAEGVDWSVVAGLDSLLGGVACATAVSCGFLSAGFAGVVSLVAGGVD